MRLLTIAKTNITGSAALPCDVIDISSTASGKVPASSKAMPTTVEPTSVMSSAGRGATNVV